MAAASTDDIYAAMDWLADRQDAIEAGAQRQAFSLIGTPMPLTLT